MVKDEKKNVVLEFLSSKSMRINEKSIFGNFKNTISGERAIAKMFSFRIINLIGAHKWGIAMCYFNEWKNVESESYWQIQKQTCVYRTRVKLNFTFITFYVITFYSRVTFLSTKIHTCFTLNALCLNWKKVRKKLVQWWKKCYIFKLY